MSADLYADYAPFYDSWASKMMEDVDFYVQRALEATGPVVELGAGTGRVSIPIAQAGRDVIAVDASPAMIARGREHAAAAGVADRITWVEGDMRSFVTVPPVDLVIIPYRAFLHMLETGDQLATLASAREALVSGGRFILNFFQPDPERVVARNDGARHFEMEFTDEKGRRCELWFAGHYAVTTQRLSARIWCERHDGDRLDLTEEVDLDLRFVYRYEFEHLLVRAGFEVDALYGWFDKRPFTEDSREMVWVARKP